MMMIISNLNLTPAVEVGTFDNFVKAPILMLFYLLQWILDLTSKLSVLARVRYLFDQLVSKVVGSIFGHSPSARWTTGHVLSAFLAHNVAN